MEKQLPGERLQAYADAFFSIIATLMVIPLAHLEDTDVAAFKLCDSVPTECHEWHSVIAEKLTGLGVFIPTFFLVAYIWRLHATTLAGQEVVSSGAHRVTIALLYPSIAFLPITARVQSGWKDSSLAAIVFVVNATVTLGSVYMLRVTSTDDGFSGDTAKGSVSLAVAAVAGVTVALAGAPSYGFYVFYAAGLLSNRLLTSLGCFTRATAPTPARREPLLGSAPTRASDGSLLRRVAAGGTKTMKKLASAALGRRSAGSTFGRERLEAFTDGVHAIVATLIVLDIKSPLDGSEQPKLETFIHDNQDLLLAAAVTMFVMGMMWSLHRDMMRILESQEVTTMLSMANSTLCVCLCLIPFSMSVLVSITPYYGLLMCGTLLMLVCAGYALILTCMVDRKKPIRKPIRRAAVMAYLRLRLLAFSLVAAVGIIAGAMSVSSSVWAGAWTALLGVVVLSNAYVFAIPCVARALGAVDGDLEPLEGEAGEGGEEDTFTRDASNDASVEAGTRPTRREPLSVASPSGAGVTA